MSRILDANIEDTICIRENGITVGAKGAEWLHWSTCYLPLLEACQAVIDECEAVFVATDEMSNAWRVIDKQLRSAIARATGEAQQI